jgi:SAM-dependent methyltransferase
MSGSVSFDRAAEYYDQTRGLSDEAVRDVTRALVAEFEGAGRVLEVGVGTGQVALPLRGGGLDLVGLDLSRAMLLRLAEKAGGVIPFPLVEGDATAMPLADASFGGAYLRWVLHLVADWRSIVGEVARVLRPNSVFAAALGSYGGIRAEIQSRFAETAGISVEPPGLGWEGWDSLDARVESLGGRKLRDLAFVHEERDDLETFVRGIERNRYSWTWRVTDDRVRAAAAADARAWAERRLGPLDRVPRGTYEWRFARYRMP